jgi:hypothetical protein
LIFAGIRARRDLHDRAHEAFDRGDLAEASSLFRELTELKPKDSSYWYMLGLAHKYRREWLPSLEANLAAVRLKDKDNQGAHWNAAIAATALGRWDEARKQWQACGLRIGDGDGPLEMDLGHVVVRLNAWSNGETLFVRRIDPARAIIENVPFPQSGHRYGDLLLTDGARTGERNYRGNAVPVFNELERLVPSDFLTFAVFVSCDSEKDAEELERARGPGIGLVEDWTRTTTYHCLRCSYGAPHSDEASTDQTTPSEWDPERSFGVAAQSRVAVDGLLQAWQSRGRNGSRRIDAVEQPEHEVPELAEGGVWWCGPEEEDDAGD